MIERITYFHYALNMVLNDIRPCSFVVDIYGYQTALGVCGFSEDYSL